MPSSDPGSDPDDPYPANDDESIVSQRSTLSTPTEVLSSDEENREASQFGPGDESDDDETGDNEWHFISGNGAKPRSIPLAASPGPQHMPNPEQAKPNLYITNRLIDKMVIETNRYAEQYKAKNEEHLARHPKSHVHKWFREGPTTPEEMRVFLGVAFNMGLVKKPSI